MVFSFQGIKSGIQQLGQKLTPDKIQQFGQKVRDNALTFGRKVSNTLGKVSDVGNKLLPIAETVATGLGFGPEVALLEGARKGLNKVQQIKNVVDNTREQAQKFQMPNIAPANIKPKYNFDDVYNLNSQYKGY